MVKLSIRDLIDLVASGVPNPEARLEKAYEWSHARRLELVKWILAAAIALFVPLAVGYFREEFGKTIPAWWALGAMVAAAALAVLGITMLILTGRAYRSYLAAQSLLGEIRKIAPFLDKYRQELERK
ncbi:MAG: hypothetical protein IPL75_11725 [Acidobacteria bacterium]|nr:hypothetical protein [Acidobacteriota bacterium]